MSNQKATLVEMAEAIQEEAEHLHGILRHHQKEFPDQPADPLRSRKKLVLDSAAHVLRIMATYEDQSRRFVAGLIEEHGRG